MTESITTLPADAIEYLDVSAYADRIRRSVRVVQRYLADDELPGAKKDERGRWMIPADARRQETTSADVVVPPDLNKVFAAWGNAPLPETTSALLTLEQAAEKFGTTEGGIRRMSDAGILTVGRFGPNGALRAYLPRDAR